MKQTPKEAARLAVKTLWIEGCKHGGIDPEARFVSWSANNPYDKPYNKAMELYQAECFKTNSIALKTMIKETIVTSWEVRTYDVWGNAKDGYDVNDSFVVNREYPMTLEIITNNPGTAQEFKSAYPSNKQIRQALDLTGITIDTEGDDLTIYVNRARDGYPCGQLHCISHKSLSPIREV